MVGYLLLAISLGGSFVQNCIPSPTKVGSALRGFYRTSSCTASQRQGWIAVSTMHGTVSRCCRSIMCRQRLEPGGLAHHLEAWHQHQPCYDGVRKPPEQGIPHASFRDMKPAALRFCYDRAESRQNKVYHTVTLLPLDHMSSPP